MKRCLGCSVIINGPLAHLPLCQRGAAGVDFPLGWHAGITAERAAYGRHVGEKSDAELRATATFGDYKVSSRVAPWTLDVARLELARREALGA